MLVATKRDFEKENRKQFVSKIATGTYDAIIIGHSSFEKIPISKERQERLLKNQIEQIAQGIKEAKDKRNESWSIKEMEKYKKGLEVDLKKLLDESRKDDLITFEQLGIDYMFVDEAHSYNDICYKGYFKWIPTITRNRLVCGTFEGLRTGGMFSKNIF